MADIITILNKILNASLGRDVRQAIHDGIETCYKEGKSGAIDLTARRTLDLKADKTETDRLEITKANRTDITSPFNFKGNCTFANLPASAKVNDTWYVTDKKCRYTWNGSAWYQSSLNESDYTDELGGIKSDLGKSLEWNQRAESKGFNRIIPIGFYIGERSSSGGAINKNSTTRCTTDYFEVKNKKFTVKNDLYNSNVKYAVWCWDENHNKVGGAISNGGWITVESYDFTVLSDTAKYFTLHIAHNDESAFTEISTIDAGMNVFDGEFKIPFELRTHESDNARLFSPYAFEIDTINRTMKCNGTFYLSYGFKNVLNVPFNISNLDLSQHGVFYYDIAENYIKWAAKSSLTNIDTSNCIALGDNWTNTYGYVINLQTDSTLYIDGIKIDKIGFDGKYADKKWLFDGDSICYGRTTSGNTASVPFPKQIMKKLGGKSYDIVAVPSACVCVEDGNGVTDMVENAVNRDYSPYNNIVMNGGTNDYSYGKEIGNIDDDTNKTFYGAWNIIINKIFADNIRANVVLITPLFRNYGANSSGYVYGNAYNIPNHIGLTLSDYCDAIVNIGKKYNIPVFDSRYNSPVNVLNYTATLATDDENKYLHPNDTTYVEYGNRIASFIESNF